jgi:UDP-galactopyranose mutase
MPDYPLRLVNDRQLLKKYVERAQSEQNVAFVRHLGTSRYLDMDVMIGKAADLTDNEIDALENDNSPECLHSEVL